MDKHVDLVPAACPDTHLGLLLAVLDDATQEWREHMEDVSVDALTWQPFAGGHSIGAVLLHMADVEGYWIADVGAGQMRPPEETQVLLGSSTHQDKVVWPVPPAQRLSWYYARQDEVRARTRRLVLAMGDADHVGRRAGETFTLRWLLNHVISHEAYHGGQAVLLSLLYSRLPKQPPAPE